MKQQLLSLRKLGVTSVRISWHPRLGRFRMIGTRVWRHGNRAGTLALTAEGRTTRDCATLLIRAFKQEA
jgi:hypothetical protein